MKSIDVDAKHLIRTYIDGIEEYLREHTRLHPNEIDGLLNEINDFIYLRSGELAVEDRVHYNDVLKAIEECGSPSEICEQYLELDKEEQPEPFSPKFVPSSSEKPVTRSPKTALNQFKTRKKGTVLDSIKSHDGFRNVSSYYHRFPVWFTLYRFFFILFIGSIIVTLFLYTNPAYSPEDWYIGSVYYVFDSFRYSYLTTLWAFILVFWESFLINKWKARLVRDNGMDRSLDDTMIIWISRIGFLLLLFKASLLLDYVYLFFVPIWLFLMCLVERQLKSELWVEKLGPWLVSLGSMFSNPQDNKIKDSVSSFWNKFRDQYSSQEKGSVVILTGLLGFSFIFPWYKETTYYSGAFPFFLISSTAMIATMIVLKYFNRDELSSKGSSSNFDEFELIAWLMRLLTFKTILILGLNNQIDPSGFYFGSVCIIGVLITSEIVLNTYGGKSFRLRLGKALITFGGSSSINNTSPTYSTKEHPLSSVANDQTSKSESTVIYSQKSQDRSPDRKAVTEVVQIVPDKKTMLQAKKPSLIARFFKGIGEIGIALMMTFLMFIVSFYEVILTFLTFLICFSYERIYKLPVLEIEGYITFLKGYTITIWHLFLLLGIQLFFIVTVQFYGLTTKKTEGLILKVSRNLTRILLGVVLINSLGYFSFNDVYSQFQLLIVFVLLFFSELTSWKVRSERKKFLPPISEQETFVHDNEGRSLTRGKITKSS